MEKMNEFLDWWRNTCNGHKLSNKEYDKVYARLNNEPYIEVGCLN